MSAQGIAFGGGIESATFFDSVPHSLVNFEHRGDGVSPVSLIAGETALLNAAEYSSLGFSFDRDIQWVNDANAMFDAAQAVGGSPQIGIPGSLHSEFEIHFATTVRAFGFWVVNNSIADHFPQFEAFDAANNSLGYYSFGDGFVDGFIGVAQYGFMGISSPTPIARVRITKDYAMLDNFTFSAVPSAGTLGILPLLGASLLRRRR
jgi:hypothetical protein